MVGGGWWLGGGWWVVCGGWGDRKVNKSLCGPSVSGISTLRLGGGGIGINK